MSRKYLCVVAIVSLAAGGPILGGGEKVAGVSELLSIQGIWQFVSYDIDGKPKPAEQLAKTTIAFIGDGWTLREGGKVLRRGTLQFDPSKKPADVDAVVTEGEGKGATMLGIYELKGDTMKLCFDPQGKERPTRFTAKAGQLAAVVQREKKMLNLPARTDTTEKLLVDLEQEEPFMREVAIGLLGKRKAREAIPTLIDLLADYRALTGSDNWVGGHAAIALSNMTGRSFSVDQKEWRRWWKEQTKEPK